ncbi:MAG: chemotaxis response regulator protein-glutamate methylesterase [Sneathiella sp.]|nr:chemotaxis response regulator protein-glutamate methylesterase [Sneathiella sp.]
MLVDDSAVIRGFLARWLKEENDIEVVASVSNGAIALREFEKAKPDVVILDIEMPEMDGMTALPKLIALDPEVKVIMASTLTLRNADISMKALSMGAADYIPKPESTRVAGDKEVFQRDLVAKVRALGARKRGKTAAPAKDFARSSSNTSVTAAAKAAPAAAGGGLYRNSQIVLRKSTMSLMPQVLAIGSSTGGPQALFKLFEKLKGHVTKPIFITQHMPATFTSILAEHLEKIAGVPCKEAVNGEIVQDKHIYLAPGDWHMTVVKEGGDVRIKLNQDPPENFCRPAVDPMLRSLNAAYGGRVLTVILTGMGHDGQKGSEELAQAGAPIIAQDEATSVVWGMPGAVATSGLSSSVLPLDDIPDAISNVMTGRPV